MTMTEKAKTCFVIAPIGEEGSDVRKRSDQVLRHIIRPAASQCGYEVTRADNISNPGLITSQIMDHVIGDDLVIADLTGHNPNVFYELAVRHAVNKPVIQLIKDGEPLPFDVSGMRAIFFNYQDLDSVEKCKADIIEAIKAVEAGQYRVASPISLSIDLQALKQSGNPIERSNAEILAKLEELSSELRSLQLRNTMSRALTTPSTPEDVRQSASEVLSMMNEALRIRLSALANYIIPGNPTPCPNCGQELATGAVDCPCGWPGGKGDSLLTP